MLEPEDVATIDLPVMKPVGIAPNEMQTRTTEARKVRNERVENRLDRLRIDRRAGIRDHEYKTPRNEADADDHPRRPVGRGAMNNIVGQELVELQIDAEHRRLRHRMLRPEVLHHLHERGEGRLPRGELDDQLVLLAGLGSIARNPPHEPATVEYWKICWDRDV